MTTARTIIGDALTFHLNRLSPGETMDADTGARCLDALNNIADEWNGRKSFLYREFTSASASPISTATGTLGTTWTALAPGDQILGATYASNGVDVPMSPLTMRQYHEQAGDKTLTSAPEFFAHDGLSTVYFYPVPDSYTITLRTKQAMSAFADLDTDYTLPNGYRSALAACLAELMAPTMNPALLATCQRKASAARLRIAAQVAVPAIIEGAHMRVSILTD